MPNRFMPVLLQIDWLLQTNVGNIIERACDKGKSFKKKKREKKTYCEIIGKRLLKFR